MGVIGSAKLLQALARDYLVPGLSIFGQGTQKSDEPIYAIILTYLIAQFTMMADINQIASLITMIFLMTFFVTNLACFLLKIGSAPNFRPSFHFFNWQTAATGAVASVATMFFVDQYYASGCVAILIILFLIIHYTTPPKSWGDVSQSLIYHQVRKYLLRLRQEHVKFWRPQILLLVNDPRRQYKLIQFCNSLKKGALFVLGHVIVSEDFGAAVPEARRQQASWTKYIDFSRIKAFVNVTISPAVEWGARNIVLGTGLGGMRPNIVVMGFYNLNELRQSKPLVDVPTPQPSRPATGMGDYPPISKAKNTQSKRMADKLQSILPTDTNKSESAISIQSYVTILEDMVLRLRINVAIAKGFQELEVPTPKPTKKERVLNLFHLKELEEEEHTKKYIDLWPIQMSAEIATGESSKNVLTTNFDTYTLILQLGCILTTVPSWKRTYKLRVAVFVEYESDVEEERQRVRTLLTNLRIQAEILVFWLASGELKMYEVIINAKSGGDNLEASKDVDEALEDEEWWQDIQRWRSSGDMSASQEIASMEGLLGAVGNWPTASFQHGRRENKPKRFAELKKMLHRSRRKSSIGDLGQLGLTLGMRTQRLPRELVHGDNSSSESSSSDDDSDEEAVTTESEQVIGSENDLSEYDLDASDSDDDSDDEVTPIRRAKSFGTDVALPFLKKKLGLRNQDRTEGTDEPSASSVTPLQQHPEASASDTTLLGAKKSQFCSKDPSGSATPGARPLKPPTIRQQSLPKFTSKPTPRTRIATDDGPGPSIMFVDQPTPSIHRKSPPMFAEPGDSSIVPDSETQSQPRNSITPAPSSTPSSSNPATGFPAQQSLPLSLNDLPCRAQHLILNELIRQHSKDTAVVLTTLPSPIQGTCLSEEESVKYMSDLEVLCQGLPPVLLVHSNSMTVTMNL